MAADPKAPWRSQVAETWLEIGQPVQDEFGDWAIAELPDDDDMYGYAQVVITDGSSVYRATRHVYLSEFLRDFRPIEKLRQVLG